MVAWRSIGRARARDLRPSLLPARVVIAQPSGPPVSKRRRELVLSARVLRQRDDGTIELDVQAVPRSSRDEVGKPHGDRLKLHVRAPPVEGEANEAIVRLLADVLELPRQAIRLVRGQTG